MFSLTVKEIAQGVGGTLIEAEKWGNTVITAVDFDTRKLIKGSLFVPLIAEKDGHQFAGEAIRNGAKALFWSHPADEAPSGIPVIQVEDTLKALQKLARYYLKKVDPKVVAITGSNGKTTTKDMTDAVLESGYLVHKTLGNFNNHIGLPITLLQMPADTEIVILEMGMNQQGEIKVLSDLVEPDVAVITMIGESHIEYFGSRDKISSAKLEIVSGLKPEGTLVLLGDEPLLTEKIDALLQQKNIQIKTFGKGTENNIYPLKIFSAMKETIFTTNLEPEIEITIPVIGTYNVNNALAAIQTGMLFGIPVEQARLKLAEFQLTKNRTEWLEGINGSWLLSDAYNANPTAMKVVLDNFSSLKCKGKKIAVLGDMLELGEQSDKMHLSVKASIDPDEIDLVVLYGPEMRVLYAALLENFDPGKVHHFTGDKYPMVHLLKKLIHQEDFVLVKASLGTDLLSVVRELQV